MRIRERMIKSFQQEMKKRYKFANEQVEEFENSEEIDEVQIAEMLHDSEENLHDLENALNTGEVEDSENLRERIEVYKALVEDLKDASYH